MTTRVTRRHFFFGTLLTAAIPRGGYGSVPSLRRLGYQSPNERLHIAGIGAGGRALSVLGALESERIVALADVDRERGAEGFARWPSATPYSDYRRLLDAEKDVDAVTVVIPDHMHATVALAAMALGKHVYVEKPLTRTPWEARLLTEAARRYRVATQMGNQGYSHDATRVAAEILWSGEIGDVTEVHSFRPPASWPQGMSTIPAPRPVPATLDWDLWLGGAAFRPFTDGDAAYRAAYDTRFGFYLPFNWRGFHDFGSSLIGDWGIHQLGPAQLGLRLGSPTSVECVRRGEGESPFSFPRGGVVIRWEFPAREGMPPVAIVWSDTGDRYVPPGMTEEAMRAIEGTGPTIEAPPTPPRRTSAPQPTGPARPRPPQQGSGYNTVFVGSKGYLGTGGRGESVGLLPGTRWADYQLPPRLLTRSPGHQQDWVRACKGGEPACSRFEVAGPYTEWMVLGAIAARVPGKLQWDGAALRFTNSDAANALVRPVMRDGWHLDEVAPSAAATPSNARDGQGAA